MAKRVRGRVAIVTGTASGIGRAVLERLLDEGAAVLAVDRNPAGEADCLAKRNSGYPVQFCCQDLGQLDALPQIIERAMDEFGRIDVLVNNAGVAFSRNVFEMTVTDWHTLLSINLDSVFFLSQAAAQVMKSQGYGRIVNISSVQGYRGAPNTAHYNAAKGGVIQITRCLAVELAPFGILVNSVAPGFVRTPMSLTDGVDETTTPEFEDMYIRRGRIPMRRAGRPEDIAAAVLYFAGDECPYVTGQVLGVDGGLSITF